MSHDQVVHVVDDDVAVRQSLAFLLGSAGLSVRLYDSALSFLAALPGLANGCVVTDIRMPEMDGLEMQRHLRSRGVELPVIVITGHADVPLAVEAMKAGAIDFIEKPFDDEVIIETVRRALELRPAANPEIAQRLASLTPREREVLDGLVAGRANKVIAFDLDISPRTVEIHRARVMEKMQARSLSQLVRMALESGISPPSG
jgi:two-component system response regulator FixJ